jgi:DNA-binding NarL/FixJ family response regulator
LWRFDGFLARNLQFYSREVARKPAVIANDESVNTLLVSDCLDFAAHLRKSMESDGITGNIHRIDARPGALTRIREVCRDRSSRRPDFIVFDLSDPEPQYLDLLAGLAFGRGRSSVPVVVLTTPESEALLQSGAVDGGSAVMFSSISLQTLVATLRNKRRSRFLRSLSVIYALGPILVQAPAALLRHNGEQLALIA